MTNGPKGLSKQLIEAAVNKLDLVTREEFEVQKQVLLKTRAKVEHLEKLLIKKLENASSSTEYTF